MKKCSALLLAAIAIVCALSDGAFLHAQSASSVVINEFRTRGPLGGNDEFIELFNPTASSITIGGWKIQGSNNAGTTTVRATVPTGATLGAGCFYLIVNTGTAGYSGAVAGNRTYTSGITDDGGVALVRGDNSIADQVGMSAGSAYGEGTRLGSFGAASADRAYARKTAGVDTNDNTADFAMVTPSTPQNVASVAGCEEVLPEIWPHDVQGDGPRSPHENQRVAVRGIVTAKRFNNGFFIQTPDGVAALEANPDTSEGLFVFTSSAPTMVNVGDDVLVTGAVSEFVPAADPAQPPVTEIVTPSIVVRGTGQPLPAAVVLTSADVSSSGGPLQLEKYEGMRVGAGGPLTVVAPTSGTVIEAAGTGSNTGVFYAVFASSPRPFREPGIDVLDVLPSCDEHASSECAIPVFDGNPERLRIDSDGQVGVFPGAIVSTGATITLASGVLDYAFRTWTILPDAAALTVVSPGAGPQPVPARADGEYLVASFNMQRFFDTLDDPATDDPVLTASAYAARLAKASLVVRDYLRTPDIIGVQEAENLSVLQDLAARIDADAAGAGQPAPHYQAYLQEGNDIGGIDVGVLARGNVTVHSVQQWRKDETYVNPVNGMNELLNDRPSLIVDATIGAPAGRVGVHLIVVVNHLRSLNGVDDAVDGRRVRAKRMAQAESVAQLLIDQQTQFSGVPIVSVGDYNAFDVNDGYVDVLGIIRGDQVPAERVAEWSPLGLNPGFVGAASPGDYSYSFDGNAQTLDHVLLSPAAAATLNGFAHARVDADFPEVLRGDGTRPERISDHDPAVARFLFPTDRIAPVFGPADPVIVAATSFDGANVTYATPTATDNLDPIVPVSCLPASGSQFPVGSTTVTCAASDTSGNTASVSFLVTVTLGDNAGTMIGGGLLNSDPRVAFSFLARLGAGGAVQGRLQLLLARPRGFPNVFVAGAVERVTFIGSRVRFTGRGAWNNVSGYTFVVDASDPGGVGADTLTVTVSDAGAAVVSHVSGTVGLGDIRKLQ
jgi:uncharacterized protein